VVGGAQRRPQEIQGGYGIRRNPLRFVPRATVKEVLMDDAELVRLFEAGEVPPDGFHHREHVRVAWWYLQRHPLPEALTRFSTALRLFAVAQNKPNLYHQTITTAYVLLINERLDATGRDLSWSDFADQNQDLLRWRPSVLDRYYFADTLMSDRARRIFVMPDRLAIG
jgi:hypothetical protein